MTTELIEVNKLEIEVKKYPVTDTEIDELRNKYEKLKINGIEDKIGFDILHSARMSVRDKRLSIQRANDFICSNLKRLKNMSDERANELIKKIKEIEDPLEEKERKINDEKERIKQEKILKEQEKLQSRFNAIYHYRQDIVIESLRTLSDAEFDAYLQKCKAEYEVEQARLAEEKRIADIEAARIAEEKRIREEAERKEREAIAAKQAEEKRIESERLANIAAEQELERQRLAAIAEEQRKKEEALKAEQARIESEKREEAAKKAKEESDRIAEEDRIKKESDAKALREAMIPDIEKLKMFFQELENIKYPIMNTNYGINIINSVKLSLEDLIIHVKNKIEEDNR